MIKSKATRPFIGVMLKIASALVLTAMITVVKILAGRIPIGEIVFARTFFGVFPVLALFAARGELASGLTTKRPGAHVARSIVGVTAMATWFTALSMMPLPEATAISFSAPFISVVFAALFLGEVVRAYRWGAVVIGLVGILVILYPQFGNGAAGVTEETRTGAMIAFAAAIFMAGAVTLVRQMTETERTGTIVLYYSFSAAILSLATLPFGWVMPTADEAALLVLTGLLGGLGQILLTQSYRYADASTLAPFDYTTMLWALLVGWLVFNEMPGLPVYVGSAIVVSAGLFVIYREHRLGIDAARARRATTPSRT